MATAGAPVSVRSRARHTRRFSACLAAMRVLLSAAVVAVASETDPADCPPGTDRYTLVDIVSASKHSPQTAFRCKHANWKCHFNSTSQTWGCKWETFSPTTSPTPTPLAPGNRHACRSGPVRSRIPATGATGAPSFAPSFEPTVLPMTPVPEAEQAAAKTVRLPCPVLCECETCNCEFAHSNTNGTHVRYESQTKHRAHPVNEQRASAYRAVAGRQAQQRKSCAKNAATGAYRRTSQRARSL
jgi:hypothetical protein